MKILFHHAMFCTQKTIYKSLIFEFKGKLCQLLSTIFSKKCSIIWDYRSNWHINRTINETSILTILLLWRQFKYLRFEGSDQDNGIIMISKWFTIEQADLKSCTISTYAKRLNIKEKLLFVHHSLKCDFEGKR